MSFKPSQAQQAFYDWVDEAQGNCVLEAVAGAGKTTTILNGIERMKGRVWFGVYNKKMADEIRGKVASNAALKNREWPAQALQTKTFHSEGMSIIRMCNGRDVQTNVDDKKVVKIVDSMIAEAEGRAQQPRPDLKAIRDTVVKIVGMAKNRGFVHAEVRAAYPGLSAFNDVDAWEDMITHFDFDRELPDECDMSTVVNFSRAVLQRSNKNTLTIDFNDMVYLPLALGLRCYTYDWVLIDEAQDTNPTRRAMATKLLRKNGRLVAVGDPHQAIFGFTGADNDSLAQLQEEMNATTLALTVTYRCPKAIVAHAQQWVSHITAHDSAPEGAVLTLPCTDLVDNLQVDDPNVNPSETAILCRYNKPLVSTCFMLLRAGIPAKIEGRDVGRSLVTLATRWRKVSKLSELRECLIEYRETEVEKAIENDQADKADRINDTVDTLMVIIDRCQQLGKRLVADLQAMIDDMFEDGVSDDGLITLCSAHKSKGLEWDVVYLLDRENLMPSKMANQDWQIDQENNLIYVAVTRAKKTLIEVQYPKKEAKDAEEE